MIEFNSYSDGSDETVSFRMPKEVKSIDVLYDGGRFTLCINGEGVYQNMCAGNDFAVFVTEK